MSYFGEAFFSMRAAVPAATPQVSYLDRNPFGCSIPQYYSLTAEITFTGSGSSGTSLTVEEWLFAWRFSAPNVLSTSVNSLLEVRGRTAGPATGLLTSVVAGTSSNVPIVTWTAPSTGGTRNWILRGHIWTDDGN